MSRMIEFKMSKGGWPPSLIQAIVSGTKKIRVHTLKVFDVSGGDCYAYSWKLSDDDRAFLETLVKVEAREL